MSSPEEIWLYYESAFVQKIDEATTQRDVERYYYIFMEYLSTQGHSMQTIEAMKPLIQSVMTNIIKKKFTMEKDAKLIGGSTSSDNKSSFPIFMGRPEDRIRLETDLKTYNRLIKWMNRENGLIVSKSSKMRNNENQGKDIGKMWIMAAK